MSDFSSDLDELASAYLDGEATAEERALVEGDPALLARVADLQAVSGALSAEIELPTTAQRDAAIAAAVAVSNVADLDVARARRRIRVASIAAALLVVLGAVGILVRATSSQSEDKFQTVAGSIGSTAAGDARTAGPAAPAAATAGDGAFASGREALGSFADRPALVAAAQSQVHGSRFDQRKEAGAPATNNADSAVATTAPTCLVPGPPDSVNELYAATAVLEGRSVQLDVFTIADGSLTLVVTEATSCTQVFSQSV